jgi:CubicO group peptidase (beta-lactamase class C family)
MQEIRQRIQEAIAANLLPGAVVMVTNRNGPRWEEAFGFADRELGRAQQIDDIFFIASSTKALAATTVFMLGEQGTLPFDHNMRRLLSHSAGIFGNDTKQLIERDLLRNTARTLAEAAAEIQARPLIYTPGEGTSYSDAGFMLAGRAAEVATGREFHEAMHQTLLAPLEMSDTFYRATSRTNRRANRDDAPRQAVLYQRTDGVLKRAFLQHRLRRDGLVRVGSGLFSTGGDLAAFLRLHLTTGNRFAEMHTDQTAGRWRKDPMGGSNTGYGFGWQLGGGAFFHAGAFGSFIWAHPEAGIGVVLLTQMPILQIYPFWREIVLAIQAGA